ncbi:hypothetical protein PV08_10115 [Exophiala spinifera]|uniref:Zn(2)-C6 fungal-type domain-containing protein n=1 Tax=Exophiala spinifera TaxID=91928 RepID=A0A0D1Y7C6_9EURO|nr:uncharacterized protein PV08_10115 [Exophiala spinifera]KIW10816.1 hypothetical protein PV08_10115 [Exophiala spinifera]
MVYSGKLSKACQPCRDKRRKCDLQTPQCSPCLRLHIPCYGYRDTQELNVRDETTHVVQRARNNRQQRRKSKPQSEVLHTSSTDRSLRFSPHSLDEDHGKGGVGRQRPPRQPMVLSLAAPSAEIALGYFLSVFAETSSFSYLPAYLPALRDDADIMEAVYAPSLAALSLHYGSHRLMCEARSCYARALRQTNEALSERRTAVLDKTLLCVLLLTTFEALTFSGRSSPRNWVLHVRGSTNILLLREAAKVDTELGRRLTYHASINTIAECGTYNVPIPMPFRLLQESSTPVRKTTECSGLDDILRHLFILMIRYVTILSSMKGTLATEFVTKCLELDADLAALLEMQQKHMPYQVINVPNDDEELRKATKGAKVCAYRDIIHTYQSQRDAFLFNSVRLIRMVINEKIFLASGPSPRGVILNEPQPGSFLSEIWMELPQKATQQAAELINDILASVPYSLELLPPAFRMMARTLLWPLSVTAVTEVCPPEAKMYIIDRLKKLAWFHDLAQAKEAATMLEEGAKLEDW